MKKFKGFGLCAFVLLLLALSTASFAYDSSPSYRRFIPEAIWAPATGGGTWTTDLDVYVRAGTNPTELRIWWFDANGMRGPFNMSSEPDLQHCIRYINIVNFIDSWDTGTYDYYGKVGCIWIEAVDSTDKFQIQARTIHTSGYGKTMNALGFEVLGDSAYFSTWRGMMIQGITNNTTYRSTIGLFNGAASSITVQVALIRYDDVWSGWENITMPAGSFLAFNPYTRWSVTSTSVHRIWINPISGLGRCHVFGATVNNATNDPAAHVAVQYD
jgi:hypothetical protein